MSREPRGSDFDAEVGLFPYEEGKVASSAYVLVKVTYDGSDGALKVAPPEPLARDFRDPEYEPRLPTGTDFWVHKQATDVVVLGSCHAARPAPQRSVGISVGPVQKRITVFGPRRLVWERGQPRFTAPEPFEQMPIIRDNAYGGYDGRVPVKSPQTVNEEIIQAYDHPGLYPRNPFGKGYVVLDKPVEDGIELPNLEDPGDLLTPERAIVRDPAQWWRQPLPWSLDHLHPLQFPRYVYFGTDAWFPGPDDITLPEVRRGFIVPGYRELYSHRHITVGRIAAPALQEGSLGMTFAQLAVGTPIEVVGMHPEGRACAFEVPPAPELELAFDDDVQRVPPQLTNLVIHPAEHKVICTWVGHRTQMPRKFIPGIHGKIPLRARIARGLVIEYETPEPRPTKIKKARDQGTTPGA